MKKVAGHKQFELYLRHVHPRMFTVELIYAL